MGGGDALSSGSRGLRAVVIVVAAAVLLWITTAMTASLVLAKIAPQSALAAWPTSEALSTSAAVLISSNPTRAQAVRTRNLATAALNRAPGDARAARALFFAYAVLGDVKTARRLAVHGETLSRRDVPTQMWLIEDAVQGNNMAAAVGHYDRAMRTSLEVRDTLLPILAGASDDPGIAREVGMRVAGRPDWWSDFTGRFSVAATSPDAITAFLRAARFRPDVAIERTYISMLLDKLVNLGAGSQAAAIADAFGQGRAGLNDGGFERESGIAPFAWVLSEDVDRSAIREPRDGAAGGFALSLIGSAGGEVARQLTALPPGRFELTALTGQALTADGTRPFVRVACGTGAVPALAEQEFARADRASLAMVFTIPTVGCAVQTVSIRAPGASSVGEPPWIDALGMKRLTP